MLEAEEFKSWYTGSRRSGSDNTVLFAITMAGLPSDRYSRIRKVLISSHIPPVITNTLLTRSLDYVNLAYDSRRFNMQLAGYLPAFNGY